MGFYDILTIAIILFVLAASIFFVLWLAAFPGKVAAERQHPQAEAINVLGWLSLLTLFTTWPIALVWAYTRPVHVALAEPNNARTSGTPRAENSQKGGPRA
jgi:hypothetical protein